MTAALLIAFAVGLVAGGMVTAWLLLLVAIANGQAAQRRQLTREDNRA